MRHRTARLLSLLGWLVLLLGACQPDRQTTLPPSRVEAVRTARQVEELLCSVDTTFRHFTVDTALRVLDRRVAWQYRKAGVKAWEKADFDGNGRLDLLVTGWFNHGLFYRQTPHVVCLLDMGQQGLVLTYLDRDQQGIGAYYCPVATVVHQDSRPLVQYADFAPPFMITDSLQHRQSFLLTYKFDGFVEYNDQPESAVPFDSIVYSSDYAYDDFIVSKTVLDAAGNVTYSACEGPVLREEGAPVCEKLRATVDAKTLGRIKTLVSYMNADSLKPRYRANVNHVPYATLTIAYRGGRKVKVFDEGEQGTFGLVQLYNLLGQLRQSQQWQVAK